MKPTGATKEATAATLSRPLPWSSRQYSNVIAVNDASDFPVGQFYDVDAAAYAITAVNERERLRELAQDFRKWLVQTNADGTEYTVWPEWVQRIDAALNEAEG